MKRNILLLLILLPAIFSCNGTGSTSNIRPRTTTHNAVHANIRLGMEYLRQGKYEDALEKLDRARLIDPGYYGTYNMLGLLYQQIGEMDAAEGSFKKALSLNGNDSNTLNNYGQYLYTVNRCDRATEYFMQAASNPLYETPEIAYYNAGRCALKEGKNTQAEIYFRRALELNPTMSSSLIIMSELSFNDNNFLNARGYLQRYLAVSEHTPHSLWLGIRIERQLGDDDAVSSYALLLRNNFPDSREAALLEQAGLR